MSSMLTSIILVFRSDWRQNRETPGSQLALLRTRRQNANLLRRRSAIGASIVAIKVVANRTPDLCIS